MTINDPVTHRTIGATTLWLYLIACKDGFSFDWQDCHGKAWCGGWWTGTHGEVEALAIAALRGATGT